MLDIAARTRPDRTVRRARVVRLAAVVLMASGVLVAQRSTATIEDQRARLPPPATCPDDIAGDWLGHTYWPSQGSWYLVELRIRRAASGSEMITGEMAVHYWDGVANDPEPPHACRPGMYDRVVIQPSTGFFHAGRVQFDATSWHYAEIRCGSPSGYNPDHYSGVIDPALQEFQSVNNDGHLAVNDPVVFRRIRCPPSAVAVPLTLVPPSFSPHSHRGGCSGRP